MDFYKIKLQIAKDSLPIFTMETVDSTKDAVRLVNNHEALHLAPNKTLIEIGLDHKNNILMYTTVATGNPEAMRIYMPNIFKSALVANCSRIILVQNSTTDSSTLSSTEKEFIKQVKEACDIMGIDLLDYIVVTGEETYTSMLNRVE